MIEIRFIRLNNIFKELFFNETLSNCLYDIDSIDKELNVYYIENYINEEKNII